MELETFVKLSQAIVVASDRNMSRSKKLVRIAQAPFDVEAYLAKLAAQDSGRIRKNPLKLIG